MPTIDEMAGKFDATLRAMDSALNSTLKGGPVTVMRADGPAQDTRDNVYAQDAVPPIRTYRYSVDTAWNSRLDNFQGNYLSAAMSEKATNLGANLLAENLRSSTFGFAQKTLDTLLQEWVDVADPFIQKPDLNAIASKADALLDGLTGAYDVATSAMPEGPELALSLYAITQVVRDRTARFARPNRSRDTGSANIIEATCTELKIDIAANDSWRNDTVAADARASSTDKKVILREYDDAQAQLDNEYNNTEGGPAVFWHARVRQLPQWGDADPRLKAGALEQLFQSADLESQLSALKAASDVAVDRASATILRAFRRTASDAQTTISRLMRGITATWPAGAVQDHNGKRLPEYRTELIASLFVIQSKIAYTLGLAAIRAKSLKF